MTMKLLNIWFCSASARIRASASASLSAGGSASGASNLIAPGTIASTIAASDGWPMILSMCAISSSFGPIWRATKASCCSSSDSAVIRWQSGAGVGIGEAAASREHVGGAGENELRRYGTRSDRWEIRSYLGGSLRSLGRVDVGGVFSGVHQTIERGARLELEDPGVVGIGVDFLGLISERLVERGDLARHRRVDVGCRLDRLHHACGFARAQGGADFDIADKNQIAQH